MLFYGSSYVGFSLVDEWRNGYLERLWVSPVSRTAIVMGRSLRNIVVVLFQSIVLIALSFLMGLEANMYGIALSLVLIGLIAAILSSFSYILALIFKDEQALSGMIHMVLLPLQLLSGITLPLTFAPLWIKRAAQFNPLAHAVECAKALFVGKFTDVSVFLGFGLLTIMMIFAVYVLMKTYLKKAVS